MTQYRAAKRHRPPDEQREPRRSIRELTRAATDPAEVPGTVTRVLWRASIGEVDLDAVLRGVLTRLADGDRRLRGAAAAVVGALDACRRDAATGHPADVEQALTGPVDELRRHLDGAR